jgi:hypothetical protein
MGYGFVLQLQKMANLLDGEIAGHGGCGCFAAVIRRGINSSTLLMVSPSATLVRIILR